ncbi:hypothetical protein RRF57_008640 [Xylaria bambusicola]|uniref:Uncharacterized protein n=1 Tax=Xylaria bambusicola TaxID=326684 RepID=A0AAN7UU83_9PEZI
MDDLRLQQFSFSDTRQIQMELADATSADSSRQRIDGSFDPATERGVIEHRGRAAGSPNFPRSYM